MGSVFSDSIHIRKRETLKSDTSADAVVIGAGLAGVLTAYMLKKRGFDTIVLEANEIASGTTKNTTAKITAQHGLIYKKLISQFGKEAAAMYFGANEAALRLYEEMTVKNRIDCDFEIRDSYIYSLDNEKILKDEAEAAKMIGAQAEFVKHLNLPFSTAGGVRFKNQAQFNPLKFIAPIAEQLNIFEHSMAKEVSDGIVSTDGGRVKAKYIVVTTHFPFINVPGYYFMRMHQERSYVLALEGAQTLDGYYRDEKQDGLSLRNYGDLLFLGGGAHRTGANGGGKYDRLMDAAIKLYPYSRVKYSWSAQDVMTQDNVPFIGRYSEKIPNLFVAAGFNKWGMTSSMVSAMIISDMIAGKKNPYAHMFTPRRFNLEAAAVNIAKDGFNTLGGYAGAVFKLSKKDTDKIAPGQAGIIEIEGIELGVYKDKTGNVFPVLNNCMHLGCKLNWNPDELSWDCPCHGSRFSYTGEVLDNPAMEGIRIE